MKVVLRGKFIALNAYTQKSGKSHISELIELLKALKQTNKQTNKADSPRKTRWQEITKVTGEINKIETKKRRQRINETKSWFFKKIKEVDNHLSELTERQRENIQINK